MRFEPRSWRCPLTSNAWRSQYRTAACPLTQQLRTWIAKLQSASVHSSAFTMPDIRRILIGTPVNHGHDNPLSAEKKDVWRFPEYRHLKRASAGAASVCWAFQLSSP